MGDLQSSGDDNMTDLPCCRLCKCNPCYMLKTGTDIRLSYCSNLDCPNSRGSYTDEQWRRLMYVPEKKTITIHPDEYFKSDDSFVAGKEIGWNDCVDAMSKGE